MEFELHILGSSSATPIRGRYQSAQLLKVHTDFFLIDCGEAAQYQLSKYRLNHNKINHIFISHLHGDHFFGLIGLLSTMNLFGRKTALHLYAPAGLDEIIQIQLKYSETVLNFPLHYKVLQSDGSEHILDHPLLDVYTIPLQHRIRCNGFLFREKPKLRKLNKANMPGNLSLLDIAALKQGYDLEDEDGSIRVKADDVTMPPLKVRSYAYCSDTIYSNETLVPLIQNVDLLYHESTFLEELAARAADTYHSTARQAAMVARAAQVGQLIIGHFSSRYYEIDPFLEEAKTIFERTSLGIEGSRFAVSDRIQIYETRSNRPEEN